MFVVDIAVPRDADPAIAEIPNVALVDIDGLKSVVDEKLEVRRDAIPEVEEIVEECAARFWQWYCSRTAVPAIATLDAESRSHSRSRTGTAVRPLPRLTEREKLLVTGMTMTIVSKLLHSVILKIREKAATDRDEALSHARVLDELFELDLAEHIAELVPHAIAGDADD